MLTLRYSCAARAVGERLGPDLLEHRERGGQLVAGVPPPAPASRPRSSCSARRPNSSTTPSACSRRATNARARNDSRSSQWQSSTTQSRGVRASRVNAARLTRNRSAGGPAESLKSVEGRRVAGRMERRRRSRWRRAGGRQPVAVGQQRDQQAMQGREREVGLGLDPADPQRAGCPALLPTPVSPRNTRAALRPSPMPATRASSVAHSACRPYSRTANLRQLIDGR